MLKADSRLPLTPAEARIKHSRAEGKAKQTPNHSVGMTLAKWNVLSLFQILIHAIYKMRLLSLKVLFLTKKMVGSKS